MAKAKGKKLQKDTLEPKVRPVNLGVIVLLGLMLFMGMCMATSTAVVADSSKILLLLMLIATLLCGVIVRKKLTERLSLLGVAVMLWIGLGWISTLYARSPQFGLKEFSKLMLAFCIFLLFVMLRDYGARGAKWCGSVVAAGATWSALLSIDKISTRILSGAFETLMAPLAADSFVSDGLEVGTRITSMLETPNVFASYLGLGVLLSLGLIATAENRSERNFYRTCLFITSLAFVLAFSMGATGTIVVAFLVYLVAEEKSRRTALLIRMVETLIFVVAMTFPIFLTAFEGWDGVQPIPLLCALLGAGIFSLVDETVGSRLECSLSARPRATGIACAGVLALALGFALLSVNLSGSAQLAEGEELRRSVYPSAGSYTLTQEGAGDLWVTIESQNQEETIMHTSTVLYKGDVAGATLVVPEDSLVVYVTLKATSDSQVDAVSLVGDGGEYLLKLDYTLLPGFVANRLQGLWANENAIQRTVFFQDGMKLFWESPIYGLGLGAFENGVFSVQEFLYETKYVHNHYIQMLVDMGVIGLAIFVSVLGLALVALVKARGRVGADPLVAALLGCIVFMICHSAVEVNFSAGEYLLPAFGVFATVVLLVGEEIPFPSISSRPQLFKTVVLAGGGLVMVVFSGMLVMNLYCYNLVVTSQSEVYLDNLETAATFDYYTSHSYWMSYVHAVTDATEPEAVEKGMEYAEKLAQQNSNTSALYVARFYLSQGETELGFDMLEKHVLYTASNSDKWNQAFQVALERLTDDNVTEYLPRIQQLYTMMQEWQTVYMGSLELDEQIEEYVQMLLRNWSV